jgi:hypothetical protein
MQCAYHPDHEPVGACVSCGQLICAECKTVQGGKIYCKSCAPLTGSKEQPVSTASSDKANNVSATPPPPPVMGTAQTPPEYTAPAYAGQSGNPLPAELKGWSWGAFVLTWIWGIFNNTWLAFLVFVPALNIIWPFVLGAKGNEWAWQNKKWDSIDHFKQTQGAWRKWGIILFIISLALFVLYIIGIVILLALGIANAV